MAPVRTGLCKASAALRDSTQLTVHLHPDDCRAMEGSGQDALRYVADAAITLGGCRLESAAGTLDARLERQLEQLRLALLKAREERA